MYFFRGHIQAFVEIITLIRQHYNLSIEMARREILDRYSGQIFGPVWAIAHPIFMMGLYVFIFGVVFKMKIGSRADMPLDYTAYLLSGLVAWMGCQEAMTKGCTAITSNASLVKQVMFPIEILPVKVVISSLFPQSVSIVILIFYVILSHGVPPATYLLLPVVLMMQVLAMTGISFVLAAGGTFFRDVKDFVQIFSLAGVYLMPIFYLPEWVPPLFKPLMYLNPFSYLIWCYQDVLYFGKVEHPWAWGVTLILSLTSFIMGYRTFRKLKPMLGNVL
ncbi:MAG: ABC transporter permease [Rhodospirillales bacterium]|nr:ABC transporter permease [Rhodospirillales bacterium]